MCIPNTTTSYTIFISSGFGLLGVLIGSFIGRINSMAMIKRQEFNKGAAEFRAAFVDIIHAIRESGLQCGNDGWYSFLRKLHTAEVDIPIEKAKILFEPYLAPSELEGFNAAWKNYTEWSAHFAHINDDDPKPDFLGHINTLLEYAKPK